MSHFLDSDSLETSKDSRAEQVKIRSIGIQAFITKPFSPDRLIAEVERVLAEARLKRHQSVMRHYLSDSTVSHIAQTGKFINEPFITFTLKIYSCLFLVLVKKKSECN